MVGGSKRKLAGLGAAGVLEADGPALDRGAGVADCGGVAGAEAACSRSLRTTHVTQFDRGRGADVDGTLVQLADVAGRE